MTKRNYLISCLWAIAIMLATVSCSKDEININLPPDETADATLKVQILPVENNTKTLGHGDNNYVETQVTTAVIGIFKTDGTLKTIRNATFATGAAKELTMSVKSGESLVYVVANVDVSLFDKVNNLTELHKLSLQLDPLKEDKANQKAFETYKVRISEKVLCINQDVRFLIKSKTNA